MIKKRCAVCGKEIEVVNPHYCLCSDECRKNRLREYYKNRMQDPAINERTKKYYRDKYKQKHMNDRLCKLCGKPIEPKLHCGRFSRSYYHEECVVEDALSAISKGAKYSDSRVRRASNTYGYTYSELIELAKESERNS